MRGRPGPFSARLDLDADGVRLEVEAAASVGASRSELMGEERVVVTDHEYDADGRLVRSVTRLPSRVSESDALLLLDRQDRQRHACPGCGHDAREAWLPEPPSLSEWQRWSQEDRDAFTEQVRQIEAKWTPLQRVCAACQIGAKQARDGREPGRHTFVAPVRRDEAVQG